MPLLTPPERIGTVVGARYELLRAVGEGASAVLFAARDRALGREVGVKVMRSNGSLAREEQRGRFRREAQTLARLRHPHLVEVFDVGETDDGMPYVVVELLTGETLADLLDRTPQLSAADTLAITLPLMGALACAHDLGVIHRDIKPANIFLHRRGTGPALPKMLDFGIAKLSDQGATMTDDGMTLGTPSFMAPEQARGEALTPAADVWAMGVTLYACLAGRLPFDAPTAAGVLFQATKHGAPHLKVAGLDQSFALAVERALALEPSRRTADMRILARTLVQTARRAGVAIPADAEPCGLPDYKSWLSPNAGDQETAELPVLAALPVASTRVEPVLAEAPRSTSPADSSSALLVASLSRGRRNMRLALSLGLLMGAALFALLWLRDPQVVAKPSPVPTQRAAVHGAPPAGLSAPQLAPTPQAPVASAPAVSPVSSAPLAPSPAPPDAPRVPKRTRPTKPVADATRASPTPDTTPAASPRPPLKDWDW